MTEYICKEAQTDNGGYLEPVTELIRCKDCKHYFPEGHVRCWNIRGMHYPVEPDEFCSRGKRKEE